MASKDLWGYRSGPSQVRRYPVGNTSAISIGDILIEDADASLPYVSRAAAGANAPLGVALEAVPTAPTNDGDVWIEVETSTQAIFEYPPDAGTVTATLRDKTCDIGGVQSIDIDASADDNIIIVDVDTDKNSVLCRIKFDLNRSGVA